MLGVLLSVALAGAPGVVVRPTTLYDNGQTEVLPRGTVVQLVSRGGSRSIQVDPDTGLVAPRHVIRVDGRIGKASAANIAFPVDAGVPVDFGWSPDVRVFADLDGGGIPEVVWLGVTEQAEMVEGVPVRQVAESWLIAELRGGWDMVRLHEDNGWGTSATLSQVDLDCCRRDRSDVRLRFQRTVTEAGWDTDEVVVVGVADGALRTLLRLDVGNARKNGITQVHWGSVTATDEALVHDEIEVLSDCRPEGGCLHRTVTTWRWSEERAAYAPARETVPVTATADAPLRLAPSPGAEPTRTVSDGLDAIRVFAVGGDPIDEGWLLVRVGEAGPTGWVRYGQLTLDADYLDLSET